jgi:hypothetical protein
VNHVINNDFDDALIANPDEPEKRLPKIKFEVNAEQLIVAPKEFTELSPLATLQPGEPFNVAVTKIMHRTAINELKARLDVFGAGARGGTIDVLQEAVRRVRDSELALSSVPARQLEAYQRFQRIAVFIVSLNRLRFDHGQVPVQDLNSCRYLYLEAVQQVSQAAERAQKGR